MSGTNTAAWLALAIGKHGPLKISILHPESGYVWQVEPVKQEADVKHSVCSADLDKALESLCGTGY